MKISNIAIIGTSSEVLIFNAAGVHSEIAKNAEEAAKHISKLASDGFKLIFVTSDIAAAVPNIIASYKKNPFPIVVSLPDSNGMNPYSLANMTENVEKAVGINLFEQ